MLIKGQKVSWPLLCGIAITVLLTGLSINKQDILEEAFDTLERINAQDWGYSSLKGLFGLPTLTQLGNTPSEIATGLVTRFPTHVVPRIPRILFSKLQGFPERPELERLDIGIKFEDYQKIMEDRTRAIHDQILSNPHEVKANIHYRGNRIKAKLRLKGDLFDHWRSKTRMSFRIRLKGSLTVKGFKRFSLHSPGSRQHPYDQIFQDFMRDAGNLSARHDYVRVFVNGENWGVMNIEEHMSKEFLEKQRAKDSIIIKFGDDQKLRYTTKNRLIYQNYRLSDPRFFISVYQSRKYLENPLARARVSYIAEKYLAGQLEEIADIGSLSRAAMVTAIWNNFHTLGNVNTRYYLNPYNLKLAPITTDQGPFNPLDSTQNPLMQAQGFFKVALASPEGHLRFKENFKKTLEASRKIDTLTSYYDRLFPNDYSIDYDVLHTNIEVFSRLAAPVMPEPREGEIPVPSPITPPSSKEAENMPAHIYLRHYHDGRLALYNLLPSPVQVTEIRHRGHKLEISNQEVPSSIDHDGLLILETELTGYHDHAFEVVTNYLGILRTAKNDFTHISRTINPLANRTNLVHVPFVEKHSPSYVIKQGMWQTNTPLVLEGDLRIEAGTTLSFGPDAYLIVKGRLVAEGTEEAPVIFQPVSAHWKGLYVLEGRKRSRLHHVVFRKTEPLHDGLLELTGGVTFYKSPVEIVDTVFKGTKAEDALNIVQSNFLLQNVTIHDTLSDGFDSDFSDGEIITSRFIDIGGDAVDCSGSHVEIDEVEFGNVYDKAISAGEVSRLTVHNSQISSVGVGIASKDGSIVHADHIRVKDYALYAAMTYVKKDMFGPSALHLTQSDFGGGIAPLRQKGTHLTIDGELVATAHLDVNELYSGEVMSKK